MAQPIRTAGILCCRQQDLLEKSLGQMVINNADGEPNGTPVHTTSLCHGQGPDVGV